MHASDATLPAIAGLEYLPGYLDRATHDSLLMSADRHDWMWSVDHRVQVYGYRYHHPTRSVFPVEALPPWASELASRLCREGLLPHAPDQLVVNDYHPGSGIFAHIDQAVWGEVVASVSLGSSCVMQFSKADDEAAQEIFLKPRSVLVLSGEARWEWRHGIPARSVDVWQGHEHPRSRRVSLTFRIVAPERT